MENIIREITIAAQGLDNRGSHGDAESLDKIASRLINIKTAQYDGTQGYFVRNTRCWNGCVRVKRSEGMSPNEAWSDCHEEWLKASMGADTSSWDKYAEEEGSEIKIAQSQVVDESILIAADSALDRIINARINKGIDISDAIPMTLAERGISFAAELSKCAQDLEKVAMKNSGTGTADALLEMVEKLSDIAAQEYIKSISI